MMKNPQVSGSRPGLVVEVVVVAQVLIGSLHDLAARSCSD